MKTSLETALDNLTQSALQLELPEPDDSLTLLASGDDELLKVINAASFFRRKYFSNLVKLNYLVNIKSGFCPEDCVYCSQAKHSSADILRYPFIDTQTLMQEVQGAVKAGATRICMVASGRGPNKHDIEKVSMMVKEIKHSYPFVEICTSLGILASEQADDLKEAGVFAYNHNLNTSSDRYEHICSTHTYEDRQNTVMTAKSSSLSPCSGAIFGIGETDMDIINLAEDLRLLQPESVPVNFLLPFEGTPLAGINSLTPGRCLRILSLLRFYFPNVEIRAGAGREVHLRSLQSLSLHVVNSIFIGDYLTSEGQPHERDMEMIRDAGFIPVSHENKAVLATDSKHVAKVKVDSRKRGPGSISD